jgi:hypothetical protein
LIVRLCRSFVLPVIGLLSIATPARAQQPSQETSSNRTVVAATVVGLISIQPVDPTYVGPGGPYLDRGLGGNAFGAGAGLNILGPGWFSATVEVSTPGEISVSQHGRIVDGAAEGRLRETLIGVLAGWANKARTLQLQGGIGGIVGTPTLNGVEISDSGSHVAFGAGVDAAWPIASRISVVVDGRYWVASRAGRAPFIGVGDQIVRLGAGIRIRLN